jgi:probable phosphoglycerate mutase
MNGNTIYFIRHGQTDWNAELRFQGQKDIPLNDHGRAQSMILGQKLARLIGTSPDQPFLCSPLHRARQTMEIIRDELGLDPAAYEVDPRLIEASYGELEGVTLAEFKRDQPQAHKRRKRQRWDFCPRGGESHEMVLQRMRPWLAEQDRDIVVVAHGVVGRVLRHILIGIEREEAAAYPFPQDCILVWRDGREILV